jgi:hypothetical protein
MAADADGTFRVKPRFTLCCAALVVEYEVLAAKDAIWNQLFEGGILFHFGPRAVTGVLRVEDYGQVAVNVAAETLKMPNLVKHRSWNDKDVLDGHRVPRLESRKRLGKECWCRKVGSISRPDAAGNITDWNIEGSAVPAKTACSGICGGLYNQ